jgi:hypothetical protein
MLAPALIPQACAETALDTNTMKALNNKIFNDRISFVFKLVTRLLSLLTSKVVQFFNFYMNILQKYL